LPNVTATWLLFRENYIPSEFQIIRGVKDTE
jgi:hypothetical protein